MEHGNCGYNLWNFMFRLILAMAAYCVLCLVAMAQAPNIGGPWYGTFKPGNTPLLITVVFENRGNAWIGALTLPDGRDIPIKEITLTGSSVSFSLDVPQAKASFKGTISPDQTELSGELIQ